MILFLRLFYMKIFRDSFITLCPIRFLIKKIVHWRAFNKWALILYWFIGLLGGEWWEIQKYPSEFDASLKSEFCFHVGTWFPRKSQECQVILVDSWCSHSPKSLLLLPTKSPKGREVEKLNLHILFCLFLLFFVNGWNSITNNLKTLDSRVQALLRL